MEMKIKPEWLKNKIETEPDMYDGDSESALSDLVMCNCVNLCFADNDDLIRAGEKRHHKCCPLFKTEKKQRVFYWEDAVDCWTPYPADIECVIGDDYNDEIEIRFKWVNMTDEEMANLPKD